MVNYMKLLFTSYSHGESLFFDFLKIIIIKYMFKLYSGNKETNSKTITSHDTN